MLDQHSVAGSGGGAGVRVATGSGGGRLERFFSRPLNFFGFFFFLLFRVEVTFFGVEVTFLELR